ncbi:hypothetical protein [Lysinibacillus sp. SGAir0095]|uniref:hypothetical protein n=1 Tax=Lysinibacillus sp. SGAir0095 TaxID=2070463 RepID=UPI00197B8015|nr:hypothetical protein [Lysinibacillus sp. SGAir0095]
MNKVEFLQSLEEVVVAPLFIGNSVDDLDKEIENNTWSISISGELATKLIVKDFINFFEKVISNRSEQLRDSKIGHDMFLYVWFDWQSAQIKFNLISDYNHGLPFSSDIEIIDELKLIIAEFLRFPYHDGIEIEVITDVDEEIEEDIRKELLKVFLYKING